MVLGRDPKLKNFIYASGSGVVIRDIKVRRNSLFLGSQQRVAFARDVFLSLEETSFFFPVMFPGF